MAITSVVQTNFTSGELDPRLAGHTDLRANNNGASALRNVFIQPLGGVLRRPGFRYLGSTPGAKRLIPFTFGTSETYVLVMKDLAMDVWRLRGWVKVAPDVALPYTTADYPLMAWTQSADTLLIVHPSHPPRRIVRTSDSVWTVSPWTFVSDTKAPANRILQPHHRFADSAITLATSGTSGTVTVTASAPVFRASHVGTRFRRQNKELEITGLGPPAGEYPAPAAFVGDMTWYAPGLAAAFDGNSATYVGAYSFGAAGAYQPNFVGADFGVAPKQIGSAIVTASAWGFCYYTAGSGLRLELRGSNTSPGAVTAGTLLGSLDLGVDQLAYSQHTITSADPVTSWRYVWIAVHDEGESFKMLADIRLFAPAADYESLTATAIIMETQASAAATDDWTEQAFSEVRGWPRTITFHQDRLALGGSRDLPNWLWLSQSADYFNFDTGDGKPADAIELPILSDRVDAIVGMISGPELQVFTTAGEFVIAGDNLTPEDIGLQHHTDVGSRGDRLVRPTRVDGATLYAARSGHGVHEFVYSDAERNFQAVNLAILAGHLINNPIEMAYLGRDRLFFVLNDDGTVAVMTIYRAEKVSGWSRLDTSDCQIVSMTVVENTLVALIHRNGVSSLEVLDPDVRLDCSSVVELSPPGVSVGGLSRFDGGSVSVLADGKWLGELPVSAGAITIADPAGRVEVGLAYPIEVSPMPVSGRRVRLVRVTCRVHDTQDFDIDLGAGAIAAMPPQADVAAFDTPPAAVDRDVEIRGGFWRHDLSSPLWKITSGAPHAFNLLSTATEMSVND